MPVLSLNPPKGGGARLVVSKYQKHTMPEGLANALDLSSLWFTFKRRIVWDLDKNQVVAAYTPQTAPYRANGLSGGTRIFGYAISLDGQYIAEGSSDSVTLYKIP